jgi:hypothetical protein
MSQLMVIVYLKFFLPSKLCRQVQDHLADNFLVRRRRFRERWPRRGRQAATSRSRSPPCWWRIRSFGRSGEAPECWSGQRRKRDLAADDFRLRYNESDRRLLGDLRRQRRKRDLAAEDFWLRFEETRRQRRKMDLKKFQFEEFDRRLRVDLQLQQKKVDLKKFQFEEFDRRLRVDLQLQQRKVDLAKFQFEESDRRLRVDLQLQQRKMDPRFQFDLLSPLQSWQSRIKKTGLKTYTILQYLYRRICIKW